MEQHQKRGPGRPTDKRKDTVLRLRIDSETHDRLNEYARKRKLSMSRVVRDAIDRLIKEDEKENRIIK